MASEHARNGYYERKKNEPNMYALADNSTPTLPPEHGGERKENKELGTGDAGKIRIIFTGAAPHDAYLS